MTDSGSNLVNARAIPRYLLPFSGALVALGPLTIDAYLPALPSIADSFHVDVAQISASVSTFLLGYAVGQFFGGPLSDQIGRKRVAAVGLGVFVLATLGILLATTAQQFLLLRFVQAIGGGFSTVIAMAMVRDLYPPLEVGRRFAMISMVMMIAPLLAPALGGALLQFGWNAIFLMFVAYSIILLTLLLLTIPETRRVRRRQVSLLEVFSQYRETVGKRIQGGQLAAQFPLAMALATGVMMIFITQSAVLYMEHYGVDERQFSLLFASNIVVLFGSNFISQRLLKRVEPLLLFRSGLLLQTAAVALLFLLVVLSEAPLWMVVPLVMLSVGSVGLINPAGMTLYMSGFANAGGSAAALYTTLVFTLGGLLGALPSLLAQHSLVPIVGVMLLSSVLANLAGQSTRDVRMREPGAIPVEAVDSV